MNDPLISFDNIHFSYEAGRTVLAGVSLHLLPGERLALTGANGCGKTTLLHLAVGLLTPAAGRVAAFGRDRAREKDFVEVRRRAGLLFQDPEDQLFCPTVLEDVAFGPLNQGKSAKAAREAARAALTRLGIAQYEERTTYRLSGGEKRLVSLACVLAMEPDVLLLDEPTCGIDEETEARLLEILRSLPQSMIIVSHEHPFLDQLATRSVRLAGGRIVTNP